METLPHPLTRDLVLIGGGHAHALVLRRWGMKPLPGTRLTVINPGPTAPYTGMLPGHVAGHYTRNQLDIDLVRLARFAGARLIIGSVEGIDRHAKRIHVPGRPPIAYDVASLDIGITSDLPKVDGFSEYGIAAKPLGAFADAWARFQDETDGGDIAVIGGGIGGLELAMAMAFARRKSGHAANVTVIEAGRIASDLNLRARTTLLAEVTGLGVTIREGVAASAMDETGVELADGSTIPATFTVGVGTARPYAWLGDVGLDLTNGFVDVGETLQSTTDTDIFAVGDCAHLCHAPRQKAGVFAVRAAPVLTLNLAAALSGELLRPYWPQSDYLKLISLGRKSAFGQKWGLTVRAPWVWKWKDRIDQRFMDRLNHLPIMQADAAPRRTALGVAEMMDDGQPLCGGCGAKVGADPLNSALAKIPTSFDPNILTGPGDDAAVIKVGEARQVITTDQLRAFCLDPFLMAKITAHHALGDVWAMGAQPQVALLTVTLPPMAPRMSEHWLEEILGGITDTLTGAGATLVGGHSSIGAELAIGLTVTGLLDDDARGIDRGQPGDALILTRPIGSGVLLAAEMAGKADGADIAALWRRMACGHARAADILRSANALTDVTGFGLAGHLSNIVRASVCRGELWGDQIPVYDGARALSARGIQSTIAQSNRSAFAALIEGEDPLLFDPQTAGGLLACVPADTARKTLESLREVERDAVQIGVLAEGVPGIILTSRPKAG